MIGYNMIFFDSDRNIGFFAKHNCKKCYGRGSAGNFIPNYFKLKSTNTSEENMPREFAICSCVKIIDGKKINSETIDKFLENV